MQCCWIKVLILKIFYFEAIVYAGMLCEVASIRARSFHRNIEDFSNMNFIHIHDLNR
jgi:hypothetical protein